MYRLGAMPYAQCKPMLRGFRSPIENRGQKIPSSEERRDMLPIQKLSKWNKTGYINKCQ